MAQMDAYHHAAQVVERLEVTLESAVEPLVRVVEIRDDEGLKLRRAENKVVTINWKRYRHTQRTTVTISAAKFEPFVIMDLNNPDEGLNTFNICALYEHAMDRFAKILQTEIDAAVYT